MAAVGSIQRHVLGLRNLQVIHKCCLQTASPLFFQTTNPNGKQKMTLTNDQYKKKKRRLEKAMRLIDKKEEKIRKPIDEKQPSVQLKREIQSGLRKRETPKYTTEELESQVLLEKDWSRYKMKQLKRENYISKGLRMSQEKALRKLKEESEELYQLAIQKDDKLLPYVHKGPVFTPPIEGYYAADGVYVDKTNYFTETHEDLTIDPFKVAMRVRRG